MVSDLPTLVMAGQYDPITPPVWGERTTEHLGNATFVEFPSVGHAASVSGDCPLEVAIAFIDDPTAVPDSSCVDGVAPVDFVVADEPTAAPVEMIPFDDDIFGITISGVRPEGWDSYGNGTWLRGSNSLDSTLLVQQAAPVALEADEALGLLEGSLDFEQEPEQVGTVEDDRTWTIYEGTADGDLSLIAVGPGDADTGVVILTVSPEERDVLYDSVLVPALEAFATG